MGNGEGLEWALESYGVLEGVDWRSYDAFGAFWLSCGMVSIRLRNADLWYETVILLL